MILRRAAVLGRNARGTITAMPTSAPSKYSAISMIALMGLLAACASTSGTHPTSTASTRSTATPPSTAATGTTQGIHKIKHVVVIMQENRSFDSYFGTYPGADGIPIRDGKPTVCVPHTEPGA